MRLTESQRKLAADNHNLIYHVLKKWSLCVDEYYGIAAEGLVRAAGSYDSNRSIAFSTYAVNCMENIIRCEYRKQHSSKRIPSENMVSLSSEISGDSSKTLTLQDIIPDESSIEDYAASFDIINNFFSGLCEKHKKILMLRIKGYSQIEIAQKMNISQAQVCRVLQKLKVYIDRSNKFENE